MASEAQKKANQKYKSNIKRFTVDFTPSEADLFLYLSNKPNKQRYIKDLIAADYYANATHKVVYRRENMENEIIFFKGAESDCETYISNQIAEGTNLYPIEEYEILEL